MLEWLALNVDLLNLAANWAMVAIWVVYLHVFLRSFRRRTLPKIVINRAAGNNLGASCFVSNMSSEGIYVESVIIQIACRNNTFSATITDAEASGTDQSSDPKSRTFQGTLGPSQYSSIGRFDDLIASATRRAGQEEDPLRSASEAMTVTVTILADYASDSLLIGAERRFVAEWQGDHWELEPVDLHTRQVRSKRQRRRLHELLRQLEYRKPTQSRR